MMTYGFERVFQDQTDLPVYRIGVDGYWTHNGFWGNQACSLSPRGDAFVVRAFDLEHQNSYVIVMDLQGNIMHQWETPQDLTDAKKKQVKASAGGASVHIDSILKTHKEMKTGGLSAYHGGDVFWSDDGTYVYGYGLGNGRYVDSGEPVAILPAVEDTHMVIIGGTQMDNVDYGGPDVLFDEESYGLFVKKGDTLELLFSVKDLKDIRAKLYPHWEPLPETPIDAYALKWNRNKDYFHFHLGNHVVGYTEHPKSLVREVWVCSKDLKDLRPAIPYSPGGPDCFRNHSGFHDPGGHLLSGATAAGIVVVSVDGSGARYFHTGVDRDDGGHPSISPDGKWVITDSYGDQGSLFLISLETGESTVLLTVPRKAESAPAWWVDRPVSKGKGPRFVDPHPNWSKDGTKVTFNAMFGSLSQVCMIDVSQLVSIK